MGRGVRWLARSTHFLLYAYMLIVPLSGWFVLSLRRQAAPLVPYLSWPAVPWLNTATTHEQRVAIYQTLLPAHIVLSYAGLGLIALHVAAAFYHHYYRRDDVLMRMLPLRRGAPATPDSPTEKVMSP
jgi:cytochrome b561